MTVLTAGSVQCPHGGAQFTAGTSVSYACHGAPGPAGPPGGGGGDGGTTDFSRVTFAGLTPHAYAGNLGGRAGAHALCDSAYPGSHFCTDWEVDQAAPPAPIPASGAWVDVGNKDATSRFYRSSSAELYSCQEWTTNLQNATHAGNLVRGTVLTPQGNFDTTWVAVGNGGCQNPRPLTCCRGGTSVRFRGFTPATYTGNLGGRAGANALCGAAFAGSHMCTNWEWDQAGAPGPVPAAGAWVDVGDSDVSSRYTRSYSAELYTCKQWTNELQGGTHAGNLVRGSYVDTFGAVTSSWVAAGNGGCQNPRAIACCQ